MTIRLALSAISLLLVLLAGAQIAHASIDVYEFSSDDKRERYHALTKELRCPKCQNQDIADSNAPIAKDMRREVHRLVEKGVAEDDVVAYMVERFGEFVTYTPTLDKRTYALWYGPVVVLALGLLIVLITATRARKNKQSSPAPQQCEGPTSAASKSKPGSKQQSNQAQSSLVQSLLDEQAQQEDKAASQAGLDNIDKGK